MYIYFAIVSFIIGALLGSFFNVCIYRIPNKKSVVNPPSHCYNCNTRLKPLDLVPILSWTLLRGKCRYCGQKISPRYALVELLTGILFVLVYSVYGPSIMTLYYSLLVSLLVIITFIDLDHYIIPDELVIFGSVGAVIFNILGQGISIKDSLLGGLICGGGMLVLIYLSNGWWRYKAIRYGRTIFRNKTRFTYYTFKCLCRSYLWSSYYNI